MGNEGSGRLRRGWQTTRWEVAKPILKKDYLEGRVTDSTVPKYIYAMKDEFKDVKYENFRSNFSRMKRTIKQHKERASVDEAGFLHDMAIYTLANDLELIKNSIHTQQLQTVCKKICRI